jgi:hypothetical protein
VCVRERECERETESECERERVSEREERERVCVCSKSPPPFFSQLQKNEEEKEYLEMREGASIPQKVCEPDTNSRKSVH